MEYAYLILFLTGIAFGSFLNVVSFRFTGEEKLLDNIYGRSECMFCHKRLRWYELIPLFSFMIQLGRCRSCRAGLSLQYPIVELLSGLIFVAVPYALIPRGAEFVPYFGIALWILVFLTFLLMSVIDFRLQIIPDSINVLIGAFGVINIAALSWMGGFGAVAEGIYGVFSDHSRIGGTFLGTHALMFSFTENIWLSYLMGAVFGGGFFGALYFLSRGRAMGFGDVKLGLAAGILLGWPDIFLAAILSFILGALWGGGLILMRLKNMKSYLPFGPFIALGVTLVFFFGYDIVNAYFSFFNLIF
jgi:leader peptidase (prepilin peptidase)/N-methyltransferase